MKSQKILQEKSPQSWGALILDVHLGVFLVIHDYYVNVTELKVCIPCFVLFHTIQDETGRHNPNWRDYDKTTWKRLIFKYLIENFLFE